MTVFGPIVTGSAVEDAVEAHLKLWLPTYLAELERQTGRAVGSVPAPRSYLVTTRLEKRPEDQIPACIIISPGLSGPPERAGDGTITAWWRIEVAIAASAKDRETSNELAKLYGAAIRTLLLQQPSLGGVANAISLVGESYDEVPTNLLDVGSYALVHADVQVAAITDTNGGPSHPDTAPADWPLVDSSHIIVRKESIV